MSMISNHKVTNEFKETLEFRKLLFDEFYNNSGKDIVINKLDESIFFKYKDSDNKNLIFKINKSYVRNSFKNVYDEEFYKKYIIDNIILEYIKENKVLSEAINEDIIKNINIAYDIHLLSQNLFLFNI